MQDKVVVAITTYNLKEYIEQALNSVLSQVTDFDFSIVVADDASTDGTVEILKRYEQKYPDRIKLILSDTNRGSLANSNQIFDRLECEYFSFLDGDDFWIGSDRLQKQVDFMDAHPEYSMCGGNSVFVRDGEVSGLVVNPQWVNASYDFIGMLSDAIPFVHTSSLLVRNTIFCNGLPKEYYSAVDTFENCALRGEDFRRILHLEQGPMYVMDGIFSAYRIHERGVWQGSSSAKRAIESAIGYNFYCKYFGDRYGAYFINKRSQAIAEMSKVLADANEGAKLKEKDIELIRCLMKDMEEQSK